MTLAYDSLNGAEPVVERIHHEFYTDLDPVNDYSLSNYVIWNPDDNVKIRASFDNRNKNYKI